MQLCQATRQISFTGPMLWRVAIVAVLNVLPAGMAAAQTEVDTSGWDCEYCPDSTGWQGWIAAGAANVSEDSFKFGDYTGMQEEGGFVIFGGHLLYRNKEGRYVDIYLDNLGLESRSLSVEGGHQGRYGYRLEYRKIPHFIDGTTQSPFTGTDNLQLPDDWISTGSTSTMSGLPAALRDVDLVREREIIAVGLNFIQSSAWKYTADFERQVRSGVDTIGGSFLNTSSLLPMPIDYVTDQVDLGVSFIIDKLQLNAAYYGSFFTNENNTLTWENPFTPLVPGADAGQLALAPDNDFHQLSVSAAYQIGQSTRLNASVAAGEMNQNEPFAEATVNQNLGPVSLPRSSLNADIDTLNYHLRLTSSPVRRLDIKFEHRFSERANNTPREVYQQVDADIFLSGLRANIPYSFERSTSDISAAYRLPGDIKLAAGIERDTHERTFQDVSETEQDSRWGEVSAYLWGMLDLRFKLARESRDASMHDPFADIATEENPALRKFNLADRERDLSRAYISVAPLAWLSFGLTVDATKDHYRDSQIGLTAAEQNSYAMDISIVPVRDINIYFFAAHDEIDSDMAGSRDFTSANWFARQLDTVHTGGAGIEFANLFEHVDMGIDYTHARTRGEISLLPEPQVPFPDLRTRLNSARLYVKYAFKKQLLLRFDIYKERYNTGDWAVDGVAVDTIPTVLTMGQISPDYNVTVFGTALEYRF